MRFAEARLFPTMLSLMLLPGCQDSSPATTYMPTDTGVVTGGDSSSGAPTTGPTSMDTMSSGDGSSSEPMSTETSASASSSTDASKPGTSTTTGDETTTTAGTTVDDSTSSSTSLDMTTDDSTSSSSSLDTTTEGSDSTTEELEPPPCFPRQVPWAQPCQAEVDGVQVLAKIPNSAYGIAVDEKHVYFTDYSPPGSPKLHRVSKCGGAVETMASAGGNPCRIKMDHLFVYISDLVNNSAIYSVAKSNGSLGVIAGNLKQTCPSVVVTDDAVLFSGHSEPGIWKVGKFWKGAPELAHDTGGKFPGWIDTDGAYIYWNQTWDDKVERIPLTGGPSEFVTDELGSYPFEVSCEHVYGNNPNTPGFWRVPVTGGPPEKVALESAHRSTIADTHVYYTAAGSHEIIEVPLAGGAPAQVAKIGNPGLLAVDATHVFWSDPDAAVIRMAPRPKI